MDDRVRVVSVDSRRPRSSRAGILAAAVAAVAAVAVAFVIGRATAPPGTTPRQPPPAAPRPPGPSRIVDGVGVGYPDTEAGAVAALLADGQTLSNPRVLLDSHRRAKVLALIATSRYAATFSGAGGRALATAERQTALGRGLATGAQTVFLGVPIAYRVVSYTPQRIRVIGYGVSVVANDQGLSPRGTWATSTTDAVWQNGDWRVDAVTSSEGPTPAPTASPSDSASFLNALAGAHETHDAP
jgi:hypothetical protein